MCLQCLEPHRHLCGLFLHGSFEAFKYELAGIHNNNYSVCESAAILGVDFQDSQQQCGNI